MPNTERLDRWCETCLYIRSSVADPSDLVKRIGVQPDRLWRKGERTSATPLGRRVGGLEYTSGVAADSTAEEQLAALIGRLSPARASISEIANDRAADCDVRFWVRLGGRTSFARLVMTTELVEAVASFGAALEVIVDPTMREAE